jgi:leucyl aminopeptidase
MLLCFEFTKTTNAIPITVLTTEQLAKWSDAQTETTRTWLKNTGFIAKPESFNLIPDTLGNIARICVGASALNNYWVLGNLATALPPGVYYLDNADVSAQQQAAIAWGLGAYQFTKYKPANKTVAKLMLSDKANIEFIEQMVQSIYWIRNLINTPTEDMGPAQLAEEAFSLTSKFSATVTQIIGDDLLTQNYPAIHAVGRAGHQEPRLIDIRWGDPSAPKITLVGKGVCFDTGGLDIKPASGMALMKKDMGGAAHVLGLGRLIMALKLPVRLRILIPAVINAISGNAYLPGAVIPSRKGLTIEIGNTDAEGRVILADALTEAASENPQLIIDMATLTGAAKVALGPDLPALFTDDDQLANDLLKHAQREDDLLWRMPLFAPYRKMIDSPIAHINNNSNCTMGGAITAALFLKEFVTPTVPWMHIDMMAWNIANRPGHPEGAEAVAIRALWAFLKERFGR